VPIAPTSGKVIVEGRHGNASAAPATRWPPESCCCPRIGASRARCTRSQSARTSPSRCSDHFRVGRAAARFRVRARERRASLDLIDRLQIKVSDPESPIGHLSGGEPAESGAPPSGFRIPVPAFLIFDEPTHGIDGRRERGGLPADAGPRRLGGRALIFISSEFPGAGRSLQPRDRDAGGADRGRVREHGDQRVRARRELLRDLAAVPNISRRRTRQTLTGGTRDGAYFSLPVASIDRLASSEEVAASPDSSADDAVCETMRRRGIPIEETGPSSPAIENLLASNTSRRLCSERACTTSSQGGKEHEETTTSALRSFVVGALLLTLSGLAFGASKAAPPRRRAHRARRVLRFRPSALRIFCRRTGAPRKMAGAGIGAIGGHAWQGLRSQRAPPPASLAGPEGEAAEPPHRLPRHHRRHRIGRTAPP